MGKTSGISVFSLDLKGSRASLVCWTPVERIVSFEVPRLRDVIRPAAPENGLLLSTLGEHLAIDSWIFVDKMFYFATKVATFVIPEEAEAVSVVMLRVCFFCEDES